MRQERIVATRKITRQLKTAEVAMDQAGIELAELCATMLRGRREAGLSAIIGAAEFAEITATFNAWAQIRERMVSSHHALDSLSSVLGTKPIVAGGDAGDKPPMPDPQGLSDQTNVVSIAA